MGVFSESKGIKKKSTFGQRKSRGNFGKKSSGFKKSKSTLKRDVKKAKKFDGDLLDRLITVRLPSEEVKKRALWIVETYPSCQICGSHDLDYPHHALDGISSKDDRTMVSICVTCHRLIHAKGFDNLLMTREEVETIGWANNEQYLASQDY